MKNRKFMALCIAAIMVISMAFTGTAAFAEEAAAESNGYSLSYEGKP